MGQPTSPVYSNW